MPSVCVLEQEVTRGTREVVVTVQESPVQTIEGALRAARIEVMSRGTRKRLRREGEWLVYHSVFGFFPENHQEVMRMGWRWHFGAYSPSTRTFKALDYYGMAEDDVAADPIFVAMTTSLDRELAQVPGIRYRFEVESFWTDPIGCVVISAGGVTRKYRYYAWYGNITTWPPSRG